MSRSSIPFFVSIPHSGEKIPPEAAWLQGLPEAHVMCDVDRFVDQLYVPVLEELAIPYVLTPWHRYVVDLNRVPDDVDSATVEGNPNDAGKFNRGFLWAVTTTELPLLTRPISRELFESFVTKYYRPFHEAVEKQYETLRARKHSKIYHLDAHSMPSVGTRQHRDPGEKRADIVVSDSHGKSCDKNFLDLVVESYKQAGFSVRVNWPYFGGRITELYGHPEKGQNAIQAELNRALYMNETTKKRNDTVFVETQRRIRSAVVAIAKGIPTLSRS